MHKVYAVEWLFTWGPFCCIFTHQRKAFKQTLLCEALQSLRSTSQSSLGCCGGYTVMLRRVSCGALQSMLWCCGEYMLWCCENYAVVLQRAPQHRCFLHSSLSVRRAPFNIFCLLQCKCWVFIWQHWKPVGRFVCPGYDRLFNIYSRYDQLISDFSHIIFIMIFNFIIFL